MIDFNNTYDVTWLTVFIGQSNCLILAGRKEVFTCPPLAYRRFRRDDALASQVQSSFLAYHIFFPTPHSLILL